MRGSFCCIRYLAYHRAKGTGEPYQACLHHMVLGRKTITFSSGQKQQSEKEFIKKGAQNFGYLSKITAHSRLSFKESNSIGTGAWSVPFPLLCSSEQIPKTKKLEHIPVNLHKCILTLIHSSITQESQQKIQKRTGGEIKNWFLEVFFVMKQFSVQ